MVNSIKWPHEMVTASIGQAPVYKDMRLALFSDEYLTIMAGESSPVQYTMLRYLQELFEDVEVYGWDMVREYHATWLQLLGQGWVTWDDVSKRAQLRRLMVWSKSSLASKSSHSTGSVVPPPPFCSKHRTVGFGM